MTDVPIASKAGRTRRRWLGPRRIALGLFSGVAIAGLVSWLAAGWMASSELHEAKVAADRLDPGWRFDAVLARRAEILPAENSAVTMRLIRSKMRGDFPKGPKRIPRSPGVPPRQPRKELNERLDAIPASERLDDATAAEIRRELRPIGPAVIQARSLARGAMGRTDPKYQYLLWGTLLPHVQASRSVARLLQADSAIQAHDGAIDGALEDCRAILGVERSIGDEPFCISQLVRIAILNIGLSAAERALNQGTASDAALARLQTLILDEADNSASLIGLRGERAMVDDVFMKLATGEVTVKQMNGMGPNDPSTATEILTSMSTAFVRHNHALAMIRMNAAVEIAKRPIEAQPPLWEEWEKGAALADGLVAQLASNLSREAIPSIGHFSNACIRIRVQCSAMLVLIGAERHRLAHGRFPDRIDTIDPRFVPRSFVDPYSGKPLIYKADGEGGLIVYSVSFDRIDDGGTLELRKWTNKGIDLGFRLKSVPNRARPPKFATLPENVFVQEPEVEEDSAP